MRRLTALLAALSLLPSCGILPIGRRHDDVGAVIRAHAGLEVSEPPGLDTARYSRPDLRPALRRLCVGWPLAANRINSSYGERFGRRHQGLDLRARTGTLIQAVLPGTVIYADNGVRGYGGLVILKHPRGLHSLYAHCSKLLVEPGQSVARGEAIALSGNTGSSTGPHLHLEIREGTEALNPLALLPAAPSERTSSPCGTISSPASRDPAPTPSPPPAADPSV